MDVCHQLQSQMNPIAAPCSLGRHHRTEVLPLVTTRSCSTELTVDSVVTDAAFQAAELLTLVGQSVNKITWQL